MPKRRRQSFTPQFKAQVVLEVLSGLKSQAEVARQHKLKPELIARWKDIWRLSIQWCALCPEGRTLLPGLSETPRF